jgi:Apea-like HEPN
MSGPHPHDPFGEAISSKTRRAFGLAWAQLTNPKSFFVPKTIVDRKAISISHPHVTIEQQQLFARPAAWKTLRSVVDRLYDTLAIGNVVTYNTIYRQVLAAVELGLAGRMGARPIGGDAALVGLLQALEERCGDYKAVFPIDGLRLDGTTDVQLGRVQLFTFSAADRAAMFEAGEEAIDRILSTFVSRNFENRVCARAVIHGDPDSAHERARTAVKNSLNVLRFGLCFLARGIPRSHFNITLRESSSVTDDPSVMVEVGVKGPSARWGRGHAPIEPFPLTPKLVDELRECLYLDDLCHILGDSGGREIDGPLRNAVYWIGEAQCDANPTTAFIKYWTSIEALMTGDGKIAETLGRSISVLMAFGGYSFIKPDEIPATYARIKKLYSRRSRIVHGGMCEEVSSPDLLAMCEFSSRTLLGVLALRSDGLRDRRRLQGEIDRLYAVAARGVVTASRRPPPSLV